MKLEEPCEGRLSSTVPWERKGETPLRDPITSNAMTTVQTINDNAKTDKQMPTLYKIKRAAMPT